MMKTISAVAAVAIAATLVVPTVSQAEAPTSTVVSYADLNLLSHAGQTNLLRRIGQAADAVCEVGYTREFERERAAGLCHTGAVASARPAYEAALGAARRGTVTVLGASSIVVTSS
jgi:UrcA family protein